MKNIVHAHYEKILKNMTEPSTWIDSHLKDSKVSSSCSLDTLMEKMPLSKIVFHEKPELFRLYETKSWLKVLTWQHIVQNEKPTKRIIYGFLKDARDSTLIPMYEHLSSVWLKAIAEALDKRNEWKYHPFLSYYAVRQGLNVLLGAPDVFMLNAMHIPWLIKNQLPSPWNGDTTIDYMMFYHDTLPEELHNVHVLRLFKLSLLIKDTVMCRKTLHYIWNHIDEKCSHFEYLANINTYSFDDIYIDKKAIFNDETFQKATVGCTMLHEFFECNKYAEELKGFRALGVSLGDILLTPVLSNMVLQEEPLYV